MKLMDLRGLQVVGAFKILSTSKSLSFGIQVFSSEMKCFKFETFSKLLYLPKVRMLIKFFTSCL